MTKAEQGQSKRQFNGVTLGIDFGTTNTVLSLASPDGTTAVLSVPKDGVDITGYRSILCFWQDRETGERTSESGPWAMDAFVNAPHSTRMLQSFKTFAAQNPLPTRRFTASASSLRTFSRLFWSQLQPALVIVCPEGQSCCYRSPGYFCRGFAGRGAGHAAL